MDWFAIHAEGIQQCVDELADACPTFQLTTISSAGPPPVYIGTGAVYKIIPGTQAMNAPLRAGGFSQAYDLTFTFGIAQFNMTAQQVRDYLLNTPLKYDGVDYKVTEIRVLAGSKNVIAGMNSLNQNS